MSVVFPWSTWAMTATLRIRDGSITPPGAKAGEAAVDAAAEERDDPSADGDEAWEREWVCARLADDRRPRSRRAAAISFAAAAAGKGGRGGS
nr:unnamed protein product [Digitaria exilis]